MATSTATHLGAFTERSWMRLYIAIALSLLLHLALLTGIPVNPTGGIPQSRTVITARLENAVNEPQPENVTQPEDKTSQAEPKPTAATKADPPAETVEHKTVAAPEPKPHTAPLLPSPSSGVEMPLIRDPTFYPASQLDVYPQPVAPLQLPYPESAIADRAEGSLLLLLLIDEFGVVNDISIVDAQPAGYFEEAARAAFRTVRFSPAVRQGHAVKSRIQFRVRYKYDGVTDAGR